MKLSTSWIKNSLRRTMSDRELADALESAGIEVEQLIGSKTLDQRIVVGKVKKCMQHPNADRLNICEVEVPSGLLSIVCGAPNVRAGLTVAVAQIGATLPDGDTITEAKLRGEISHGMLCSGRELGISDDHDGLIELDDALEVGTPVAELYPADGQIEIKTAANRPDLQSVIGLTREVAAQTDSEVLYSVEPLPELAKKPEAKLDTPLAKQIVLAELNLGKGNIESLRLYQSWLRTSNVRNISPVVDITNIVMIETGQPLHAYDADKVTGAIVARMALAGETLVTLDGKERKLTTDDLVIADDEGPIGLAGVMGGARTEFSSSTKRIYLEAATFDGAVIRKAAQRHKLRSEASARFERDLPIEFARDGLMRGVALLQEHLGAELVSVSLVGADAPKPTVVELTAERLERLVKDAISLADAGELLAKLGFSAEFDGAVMNVTVPFWRPDVNLPEDLIEDIVRVAGYDKIPATLPLWQPRELKFDYDRAWRKRISDVFYGAGLFEVFTYSFVSAEQLELLGEKPDEHLALANPMSQEQAYLRRSPLPSLLATMVRNEGYRPAFGIYELTGVFEPTTPGELPTEPERLAVMWQGRNGAYATLKGMYDALVAKLQLELTITSSDDTVMARGRSGSIELDGAVIGRIGQLAPAVVRDHRLNGEVAYLELDVAALLAAAKPRHYDAPSKFPVARRDLAVVVNQTVTWQAVAAELIGLDGVTVSFLNDYYGDDLPVDHKSLALRITMSAPERTLTDAQVDETMRKLTKLLKSKFSARVR